MVEAGADKNALDKEGRTAAPLVPRNGSIAAQSSYKMTSVAGCPEISSGDSPEWHL